MKYSKTALGLLNAQYRSVLRKCMLINLGLFALGALAATPANAETNVVVGGTYESTAGTTTGGTVTDLDTKYDASGTASGLIADALDDGGDIKNAIDTAVSGKADSSTVTALQDVVGDDTDGLVKDVADNASAITALQGVVGDDTDGLVKDVADLQGVVGDNTDGLVKDVADNASAITALQGVVGDDTDGLVKDVADNASAIEILNGGASTEGSVAYSIAQALANGDNPYQTQSQVANTVKTGAQGADFTQSGNISADTIGGAIAELDSEKVAKTTTINGHALTGNITLAATDVLTDAQQAAVNSGITGMSADVINGESETSATVAMSTKGFQDSMDNLFDNESVEWTEEQTFAGGIKVGAAADGYGITAGGDVTAADVVADSLTLGTSGALTAAQTTKITAGDNGTIATTAAVYATTGKIDGLAADVEVADGKYNLDQGSTVSSHLVALAGAIGDRSDYATATYLTANETVAESLVALDGALDTHDDALIDVYAKINGGTYNPATGAVTDATALNATAADGTTAATNLTEAVNGASAINQVQNTSLGTLAGLIDGGSVDATGAYTAGVALNAYKGKSTLTEVVNALETGKQETLVIADNSGLKWTDADETALAVKLADTSTSKSGLQVDNNGISVKVGDTMTITNEGYVNIKYDTDTFTTDETVGLKVKAKGIKEGMIDDAAVDTLQIKDGAVTNDKLALLSVDTGNIIDGAVTTAKLADNAVSTAKIQDEAVTFGKIASAAVDTTGASITAGTDNVLTTGAAVKAAAQNADYNGTTVKGAAATTDTIKEAIDTTTAALNNVLIADGSMVDDAKVYVEWNGEDSNLATVLGNGAYAAPATGVAYGNIAAGTNLTNAAAQLATNIGAAASAEKGNIVATNTVNANLDALDVEIGADDDYASANNGVSGDNSVKANINAINAKLGNVADVAVNGYDATADDATLVAAVNKLDTNMEGVLGGIYNQETGAYDATALVGHGLAAETTNLSDAMNKYAVNVENALGGAFDGNTWNSGAVLFADAADYTYNGDEGHNSVMSIVNNIASNIGSAAENNFGNLDENAGTRSVNVNLDALDASIGNREIDSYNDAINEGTASSVAEGLFAAGQAIGDMNFDSTHYVAGNDNLSDAVRNLDGNLYRVDREVHEVRRELNRGMASMAAMSALVPNPRAKGNTSLAIGTGAYSGHTAMAIGGFHHLTDNLMLNAGAAWGNSSDVSCRLGLTWSW